MINLDQRFLRGSYTPVVTPFKNEAVDYEKFAELVERQVTEGSHGVVITGTSGEPSSLTIDERAQLIELAVKTVARRIPVVAATGSQSFAETIDLSKRAEKSGADALMVVTPYYIKPSQNGLVEYFCRIGQQTLLPLLLYHIPGRAAVTVTGETISRIAERAENFVGIKHSSTDLELITELIARLGSEFRILCGLESLTMSMLMLGASGTTNAAGNLVPQKIAMLCTAVERGDVAEARRLHAELFELNKSIFLDTNPIPLKYMLHRVGLLDSAEVRLPLISLNPELNIKLDKVLSNLGLL